MLVLQGEGFNLFILGDALGLEELDLVPKFGDSATLLFLGCLWKLAWLAIFFDIGELLAIFGEVIGSILVFYDLLKWWIWLSILQRFEFLLYF